MKIHKRCKEDIDCLKKFVETTFSKQEDLKQNMYASMKSKMNSGIYSLDIRDELAVVATTLSSTWHPHVLYVRLAYDAKQVDGTALMAMIGFLKDEFEKPLFFLIDNRFGRLEGLLAENGFRFIRKTEVIRIHPVGNEVVEVKQPIKTVSKILGIPVLMASLIELCTSIYTETHRANPVADLPMSVWRNVIMDDLMEENSYVVLKGNTVTAFSLMYQGEVDSWELGWLGVGERSEIHVLDLIVAMQLRDATEHGILHIEKEVDSTCPYSLHIVKSLSYEVTKTLDAFIEE